MFTIKDLQDVELLFGLEELKVQGDVVALLHTDHPGAHLLVGVVFWKTWTQDHAHGVEKHLVVRASHWKRSKFCSVKSKGTIIRRIALFQWRIGHSLALQMTNNPPCCCDFH